MTTDAKPELISFALCPYVQRSVITLREKGVDFDITYIELDDPPAWFLEISPLGKVPALRIGDTVLFESAVINEYLDEVHPPAMHPADPLRRAHNRAWIEFGSHLLMVQYEMIIAPDAHAFENKLAELHHKLARVAPQVAGPYFNGERFSLVDAAYAPLFQRLAILNRRHLPALFEPGSALDAWSRALLERPSVRESVVEDFEERLIAYLKDRGSHAAGTFRSV